MSEGDERWIAYMKTGNEVSFTPKEKYDNMGNKYNTHMSNSWCVHTGDFSPFVARHCDWHSRATP